jgi:microcephalin
MSGQITYSREVLQRVSDRKNRKLAIDDSNKMVPDAFDTDLYAPIDSQTEVIEDSQSSIKGHRDLFGVLIPDDKWGNNLSPKTKSNKKTSVTKSKKKLLQDTVSSNSFKKPQQIFIPTPKIVELMKEAQTELYTLMGLNKSSSDLSVSSSGSLNVSGVQRLDNKNEEKSSEVLKGKFVFNLNF